MDDNLYTKIQDLQQQLREARETIDALNTGNIDALVRTENDTVKVYTQETADKIYRILIEKMHEGAVTLNADGVILYCNSYFANMVMAPLQKVIGTNFKNYIGASALDRYEAMIKRGWESYAQDEVIINTGNGISVPVLMSLNALSLDNNSFLSIIITDITVREKNEQELSRRSRELEQKNKEVESTYKELLFQISEKEKREIANRELQAFSYSAKLASQYSHSLIEASHDPLFAISIEGKITDLNNASEIATGLSRKKLIGTDFFDYFTEPQKARELYQEVFAKEFIINYPLMIRNKNGNLTDVLFNGSVYKDNLGNILGVVIVARDVTSQKRFENELIEAKGIAERERQFAENAMKAKQQFLSNMSHEIRTPMNAIIGFTKVLHKTSLTSKQKEYLSAIKTSGDALIVLINDILDLAKVDAGKMTFDVKPFNIETSISAMLHIFETKIQEKNLVLIKDIDKNIPEVLLGDPVRLHQIILNLVSNAVKFTTKGEISVRVGLIHENEGNATIEFSVADTGIGIDENKLDTIFENFQQATSETSRLFGGTGLGLAIVKQLVEQQGGSVSVKSNIDKGSTFSFILSFQKTINLPELATTNPVLNENRTDIKILVVEDMALNQLLMKTVLNDFGMECDIVGNGKIAIDKLQSEFYDIILMDLQMPVMNGFEATAYIRNQMLSDIPIIALTADVTTMDMSKCNALGINDYISKPIDDRLLYEKIIRLFKTISL